ncbi:acetate--CoA ligase [Aeropyrum camini]|uniref:Acetate--CoA ligase n=1 Tax=Aeropyrum camini SY1 = JCM 12091 TaxID=1198449 RepID=U3TC36_9CREN|nr:acetate--CoA ligase [Aeropyrum camini]BAN91102.1 acetyl-coenzyme A synthetase [Aeropyrum camini SY1 = JCM 12091]
MSEEALPFEERYYPDAEKYLGYYRKSIENIERFWDERARELVWLKPWHQVLDREKAPFYRWFVGGETNINLNALDRWIGTSVENKVAYYWEGEPGDRRVLSYGDLYREVNRLAYALKEYISVKPGDRVAIYLPMIPELPISMLAVTRIGAIHSVVFSGFSSWALADRIVDAKADVLITADGFYRRGRIVDLKKNADEAVKLAADQGVRVRKVIVVKRAGNEVRWSSELNVWYHDLMKEVPEKVYVKPEPRKSDDVLFILYTSGTTGKPKGIMHSVGGYMTYVYNVFRWNWDPRPEDVFWTAADIGWITGHTYIVYGPLMHGETQIMYEGAPDYPNPGRIWEMVERYGVTVFYTSPTLLRLLRKYGDEWVEGRDFSRLRLLGTVGEPINPEVWKWYYEKIGWKSAPIVDTWWQTETGAAMISPAPGIALVPLKPGSATLPLPGIVADVLTSDGRQAGPGEKGYLVVREPWPGMMLGIWGDPDRYVRTYWTRFSRPEEGVWIYYPADYAVKDSDGYFWILGRADEVLNVAGHRIGTIELEDALLTHPAVSEAAVVGAPDPVKGEVPVAFVVLRAGYEPSEKLEKELRETVRRLIGPIAEPSRIYFVEKLPKTRSGKIMRRIMISLLRGQPVGDVTTLEDPSAVDAVRKALERGKTG